MSLDVALHASPLAVENRIGTRIGHAAVLALLAGVGYPFTPTLLYGLAIAPSTPVQHVIAILAGTGLVLAIPCAGGVLLWMSRGMNDTGALRARGAGMLLIVAPVVTAMLPTVATLAGWRPTQAFAPQWTVFWALASGAIFWRSTIPRPILSSLANRRIRRVHRTFVVLLIAFAAVHLLVNLTALRGLGVYDVGAGWFRLVWRTPVGEPVLIAVLVLQAVSGVLLALDASVGRSTFEHLCQIAAGLFVAAFLTSHTLAVAVLGRALLNRGPDFTFASAGPHGVLASPQAAALYPYYALAVVAVFVHVARPFRLLLQRKIGASRAAVATGGLVVTGVAVSVLLVVALLNPGR